MNLFFLCTISLLLAHNLFGSDELRGEINTVVAPYNTMTPEKFFKEVFNGDADARMICVQSKETDDALYQKALANNLDAMWYLAKKTDVIGHIPSVVPMYWLSKLSQRIDEIPRSSCTIRLQNWAEKKLNDIAQYSQLHHIKVHEEIESRKRKFEYDRAASLLKELDKKKQKLDERVHEDLRAHSSKFKNNA